MRYSSSQTANLLRFLSTVVSMTTSSDAGTNAHCPLPNPKVTSSTVQLSTPQRVFQDERPGAATT